MISYCVVKPTSFFLVSKRSSLSQQSHFFQFFNFEFDRTETISYHVMDSHRLCQNKQHKNVCFVLHYPVLNLKGNANGMQLFPNLPFCCFSDLGKQVGVCYGFAWFYLRWWWPVVLSTNRYLFHFHF